ncbi:odorant receptor 46a [Monomorium pharaonis]|uniref:odorant receptor 46a n=1 Tax=Monomorium pharaonis TaxID=307658 RepID=UPI00063F5E5C|nr:odorant receptor 46a [Monomorium pharaonis]
MHILKLTYTIVIISGCFRPQSWTSLFKRTVYNIYRLYIITMICTFTILQVMDIILYANDIDDVTNNLYMILNVASSCYKIIIMTLNYEKIVALISYLIEEPFKPLDSDEIKIRQQYDQTIRNNTLRYTTLVVAATIFGVLFSLFTDFRHKQLKFKEWEPFNSSSYMIFCFQYVRQILSGCHSVVVSVATDNLICGFLMHICCQIEILEYRLKKILSNQVTVGYCVDHHNRIFEFAQIMNVEFTKVIGFQFVASAIVICCNLYKLSVMSTLNADNIWLIMYTSCILTQIFIYCWFGNKVKLKSLQLIDSIFHMEWPMDNSVKKNLLMIMKRVMTPIEISTVYIINMNLNSFVTLLKTSYSVYNLLVSTNG